MGVDRNLNLDEAPSRKRRWDDSDSCRYYICGFCPHDLFLNTKVDLGFCEKVHDDELKKEFEAEPEHTQRRVRERFERFLRGMVDDLDRKIQHGNRRVDLAKQSDEDPTIRADGTRNEELQRVIAEIEKLTDESQKLGGEGKVMESQKTMAKVDELKRKKEHILNTENQLISSSGVMSKERRMLVCEVCGAFLVENEAEPRVKDHLNGKIHTGFTKIREFLKEKEKEAKERSTRGPERHPDRERLINGGGGGSSRRSRDRSRSAQRRSSRLPATAAGDAAKPPPAGDAPAIGRRRRSRSRDRHRSSRSRHGGGGGGSYSSSSRSRHGSSRHGRSRSRSRDRDRSSRHRSSRHRRSHRSRSRSPRRHRSSRHRSSRHRSSRHRSSRRNRSRSRSSGSDSDSGSDSGGGSDSGDDSDKK